MKEFVHIIKAPILWIFTENSLFNYYIQQVVSVLREYSRVNSIGDSFSLKDVNKKLQRVPLFNEIFCKMQEIIICFSSLLQAFFLNIPIRFSTRESLLDGRNFFRTWLLKENTCRFEELRFQKWYPAIMDNGARYIPYKNIHIFYFNNYLKGLTSRTPSSK